MSGGVRDGGRKLALANLWVAIGAFAVASGMAFMQSLSRANLDLPFRSASVYYMSVTAHGVLMAIVFTTFFIMGFGYVVAERALGRPIVLKKLAWASWWGGADRHRDGRLGDPVGRGVGALHLLSSADGPSPVLHRDRARSRRLVGLVLGDGAHLDGLEEGESGGAHAAPRARHARDDHRLGTGPP